MIFSIIILYSQTLGYGLPQITDTSFVRTELFIPGTGKSIHWLSLNSTRCGIVRTLVRQHLFCPINRFSEKVNLANVETSLLCALIYLSPMKAKTEIKMFSWKHVDVPNATVHRIGWIVEVNFRLYLASNELRRERFCLSNMQISDLWEFPWIYSNVWLKAFEGWREIFSLRCLYAYCFSFFLLL